MTKRLLIFALLAFAVVPLSYILGALAQTATPTPTAPPVSEEVLKAGLWRRGKATFSDISFLDLLTAPEFARGYKPEQPVVYSHQIHVEKAQIECQYCHSSVAKSAFATVPSVESCMGCHKLVKADSEGVKKLKQYYDEQRSIPWEPVSNLPEHAQFTHERHTKAGVACHVCHGQMQKTDVAQRFSSFKMGWCVSCHRERGATDDCVACHH